MNTLIWKKILQSQNKSCSEENKSTKFLILISSWSWAISSVGLSVTSGGFSSRLLKCSFHSWNLSSWIEAFIKGKSPRDLQWKVNIYIYNQIALRAWTFMTRSCYPSLSFIAPDWSFRQQLVFAHRWCMWVFARRLTLVCPWVGVH